MIELIGAPSAIVVDAAAVGPESDQIGQRITQLLRGLGLRVISAAPHARSVAPETVGIFGSRHDAIEGCYGWYVGSDACPGWLHPTAMAGPRATERILGLLGTGFAQERAAIAFRSAGADRPIPSHTAYPLEAILDGISRSVGPQQVLPAVPKLVAIDHQGLIHASVAALERCCAPNGAIAAAPPTSRPGAPDYWFFWQRDAAHVAVAMDGLASGGGHSATREWARERVNAYVRFVSDLGSSLQGTSTGVATSRCTMDGAPIVGYGDPQPDGPAATAIALLAVVRRPREALTAAEPYLEFLVADTEPGFDLWELTEGRSFHAVNLARRALRRAERVADRHGEVTAAGRFARAAAARERELDAFRSRPGGGIFHVLEPEPAWFGVTSRLDASSIGSVLLSYDVQTPFGVDDPDINATFDALARAFRDEWPINRGWAGKARRGFGVGRFPEDCNDGLGSTGGNPWPVATLWAAQFHLRRAAYARAHGLSDAQDLALADGYLAFVLSCCGSESLPEQIDGVTGAPRGAGPLAWSHAELITTLLASQQNPAAQPSRD